MLHCREYGADEAEGGPPLALLHGGPGAPGTMAPLGRALGGRWRVLEPFQRRSDDRPLTVARHVEDLHELLDARFPAPTRVALAGSSWGAMLALAAAAERRGRFASVALIGCGTFDPGARALYQERSRARIGPELERELERVERELADPDERLAALGRTLYPAYSCDPLPVEPGRPHPLELEACDARGHRETWADALRLQAEGEHPRRFARIDAPVLMLHGDRDPHPGPAIRDGLAPIVPRLEYVELAECGHYPWLERRARARFLDLLEGWLGSLPPS